MVQLSRVLRRNVRIIKLEIVQSLRFDGSVLNTGARRGAKLKLGSRCPLRYWPRRRRRRVATEGEAFAGNENLTGRTLRERGSAPGWGIFLRCAWLSGLNAGDTEWPQFIFTIWRATPFPGQADAAIVLFFDRHVTGRSIAGALKLSLHKASGESPVRALHRGWSRRRRWHLSLKDWATRAS